ncbi:transporter substrate-binding domain-containing protein [Mesorhizobium sp.]|uniref:transporter substrate-binding domain-containing protein n=1 Tax=Mesorhizobium sp. TaxID=1871066 RepID=UPI000FE89781|nr:transporter substrate-binding domain-containing protein [Mesorhizobium sp.]RWM45455.1 MAG: transporter substrate-binding domain-containing protein [Mesorhizobium sp.]RWM58225.1 MAG: transporter substrate-binding domain-containing protein [Mesorhizobium sp.]RWM58610.1 MAG: transporter substrate-binding domain-containing protein [Mesorhizobium sp.]TIO70091.1 MAG: transporter substrate-binding domain-containing protein [Mesorhizobium sp.]TJV93983.1 MAG: transporter substrate-binding domain-con
MLNFRGAVKIGLAGLCLMSSGMPAGADTIKAVRDRGKLLCPVAVGGFYGFSEVDDKGLWKGIDVDLCKAIATAILGPGDNVTFSPVSWAQRIPSLQSGALDILTSQTHTMKRDTQLGVQFSLPYFHAATQLLVAKDLGATGGKDLDGATICVTSGTSTGVLVSNYLRGIGVEYTSLAFEATSQAKEAFLAGRCDVFGGFGPVLATLRVRDAGDSEEFVILPDLVAGEPTSVVVRQNDKPILDVANYVISALLEAEALGITQANVEQMRASPGENPRIKVLLGVTPFIGENLKLDDGWAYNVIRDVGNYGEIYDRSLGENSPYKMDRNLNRLWTNGGMLYPIPLL